MIQNSARIGPALAAAFLAAYFVYFTAGSLRAEFTHDDLMNGYRGWSYPLPSLLADNLLFFRFSPTYRPFGALVYKAFFAPFGFDLFALRVFLWLVLAVNLFLVYRLCRILTGSRETGLFAALLGAYHAKLGPLYYNTGTIYDILCCFFYFAGLIFYVGIRRRGKDVSALQASMICVLYIFALNSKEVAVSLPVALLGYELLWHPPALDGRALWRWLGRQTPTVWVTAVITAAYVKGRVLFQERGISNVGDYAMSVSAGEYFNKVAHYLNELCYARDWFDARAAAVFVFALLAAGVLSRCRTLLLGTLLFLAGMLPLAFIHVRALSAVYLPLAGLAVCAAVLLEFGCARLRRLSQRPAWPEWAFPLLFAFVGLSLMRLHPTIEHVYVSMRHGEYAEIRDARERLRELHPDFPTASRILIIGTPFPQYSPGYNNMFLIRLAYRDESLTVDELARYEENRQTPDLSSYHYLLSWEEGRWIDADPAAVAQQLADR